MYFEPSVDRRLGWRYLRRTVALCGRLCMQRAPFHSPTTTNINPPPNVRYYTNLSTALVTRALGTELHLPTPRNHNVKIRHVLPAVTGLRVLHLLDDVHAAEYLAEDDVLAV
jgi:hypothetical protein